jgi:SSS family solute:Na+ symporter
MASLLTGLALGLARLSMEAAGVDAGLFTSMNFLHFAIGLFLVCSAVLAAVSLMTDPPPADQIAGLTFATADKRRTGSQGIVTDDTSDPRWQRTDVIFSALLILTVLVVWFSFS